MVETLRRLGFANGGEECQKEEELRLKPSMVKTFAEVVKRPSGKERAAIRGNLGLAKLERGIHLGWGDSPSLEKWRPETGCLMEGRKSEAWVRVVGLPVSLWDRDILRRIGEECGGFLAVDSQTEKLEELQWARILVKHNGEDLPNVVEVWVEELCYSLTLWWEVKPIMRAATARKKGKKVVTGGEVGGEAFARTGERVLEANDVTRPCCCLPMGHGGSQAGRGSLWTLFGALTGRQVGPKDRTLEPLVVPGLDTQLGEARPSMVIGPSLLGGPDSTISSFGSKTDALMEEVVRYENDPILIESLVSGYSSSPSSLRSDSIGEYYNLSGAGLDITQGVSPGRLFNVTGLQSRRQSLAGS
ncbi:hypothetical protein AAG906_024063 [Vitis piasezkii]